MDPVMTEKRNGCELVTLGLSRAGRIALLISSLVTKPSHADAINCVCEMKKRGKVHNTIL